MSEKLEIIITAVDNASSVFSQTGEKMQATGSKLMGIGATLTAGITVPLAAAGGGALKLAADAIESENLFDVSMKDMKQAARGFSEQLRNDLGLNAYEVRKNVGVLNTMFSSMGLGKKEAYDLSTGLSKLAYDMASFYNISPEQAFEKLKSGMVGMSRPLQDLGILVKEETVKQYAYKAGIAETGKELTETQKVLGRYAAILAQTSDAQGDLARTLDSPTNQLRVLKEQGINLAIDFGTALIPALKDLLVAIKPCISALGEAVKWFAELPEPVRKTIAVTALAVAAIGPLVTAIGGIIKVGGALISLMGFLISPVGLVTVAIGALVVAGVALYKNWDTIKQYAKTAWNGIISTVSNVIGELKNKISDFVNLGGQIVDGITEGVKKAALRLWNAVRDAVLSALQAAKDVLGISSPSKVFADQVGHQIMAGVATGIKNFGALPQIALPQLSLKAALPQIKLPRLELPDLPQLSLGGTGLQPAYAGGYGGGSNSSQVNSNNRTSNITNNFNIPGRSSVEQEHNLLSAARRVNNLGLVS